MNEYDTELVKSILEKESFSIVKTENEADIIMLNTARSASHLLALTSSSPAHIRFGFRTHIRSLLHQISVSH
jgi:hypothetical protein